MPSPSQPAAPIARAPQGIRWWPLAAVVLAGAAAFAYAQLQADTNRQRANTHGAAAAVGTAVLAAVWFFAFAGIRGRVRAWTAVVILAVAGTGVATLRVRGVTGDLLPIFEWRWASGSAAAAAPTQAAASGAAPAGAAPAAAAAGAAAGAGAGAAAAAGAAAGAAAALPPASSAERDPLAALADYPQFLGPRRDAALARPALARDWHASPPRELWRRPVGEGWAGFAVAGRRAVTHEQRGEHEVITCYDAITGAVLWEHQNRARYDSTIAGVGPRATPTLDSGRCFALGATGILDCLDLATGELLWSVNALEAHGAPVPEWGLAGSPLVVGARVIVSVGGQPDRSLVAHDRDSGALLWSGGADAVHYAAPALATLHGVRQVLAFTATQVAGHDLDSGQVLWAHPWQPNHPHVCTPLAVGGDAVFVSSGYGTGCALLRIARDPGGTWSASQVWKSLGMKAKFTNVVQRDGFVYGLDDGILACVDLADGRRRWKSGRYGHGQVVLVGELLLVCAEDGEVVLVEPTPAELRELTRFRAFDHKTWNPPALAGELLLLRNDREAACFWLPVHQE